jgi:hypothetical protein
MIRAVAVSPRFGSLRMLSTRWFTTASVGELDCRQETCAEDRLRFLHTYSDGIAEFFSDPSRGSVAVVFPRRSKPAMETSASRARSFCITSEILLGVPGPIVQDVLNSGCLTKLQPGRNTGPLTVSWNMAAK